MLAILYPNEEDRQTILGFTLIELVISMMLISIGLTGIFLAYIITTRYSADPVIVYQATAIGESYIEEIAQKSFPTVVPCPTTSGANRTTYTSICDYNNLSQVPTDQNNNAIAGLGNYTVTVNINTANAVLGSLTSGTQVVRIDVTVAHPNFPALKFSEYRTRY